MARFRRQNNPEHKPLSEINVTPLVDVMLVLLIIFMVAAPLINPGQIDLPQVGAKLDPAVAPLEVRVRANGELAVVDRSRSTDELLVSRAQLLEFVRRAQQADASQAVVIAGDKNARYEEVIGVMDLLKQNRIDKVGLLLKPASG